MSILKKPYEISVYEDIWDEELEKFKEQKLITIGSHNMTYKGKAIEPILTRNANGSKTFSFKIYRYFYDETRGRVENPFYSYLISERKVKLHYNNKWYDFIIKNINEDSSNYQYTYELEDALVHELSKNGFGVTFDQELSNNSGTATYLATKALEETDWCVKDSEVFVQTVEEDLVYLQLRLNPKETFTCKKIYDQTDLKLGVDEKDFEFSTSSMEPDLYDSNGQAVYNIFGFYSCCKNEPYRFQFIYLGNEKPAKNPENRVLTNKNCQYYIDLPNLQYIKSDLESYQFTLPQSKEGKWYFNAVSAPSDLTSNKRDYTVSALYRGARYGYAQQAKYIKELERYVNIYKDNDNIEWYGYEENEYVSPEFVINYITNPKFESTSGWVAGSFDKEIKSPKIEAVLGAFSDKKFVSFVDGLGKENTLDIDKLSPYLKVSLSGEQGQVLFNTGPTDNRGNIEYFNIGEEWAFKLDVRNISGEKVFVFQPRLLIYDRDENGNWRPRTDNQLEYDLVQKGEYFYFTINKNPYKDIQQFTKYCKIRLALVPTVASETVYYIEKALFFKVTRDENNEVILPIEDSVNLEEIEKSVIVHHYYYFLKEELEGTNKEDFAPSISLLSPDYDRFKPVFNTGAEKVRSITAKESNYFNILQSISETFGGWVLLGATRDENGAILTKTVSLKNYLGTTNYAKVQYGVNLKNIQRTFESKNIVTKLLVKQNSNQLAQNGFCTIARAGANPTGESYVYDFQYYLNQGLLNAEEFIDLLYNREGEEWGDAELGIEGNINGYFPRLREINNSLTELSEQASGLTTDIIKLRADLETAKQLYLSAEEQLQITSENFYALTDLKIEDLLKNTVYFSLNNSPFKKYETGDTDAAGCIYVSYYGEKVKCSINIEDYSNIPSTLTVKIIKKDKYSDKAITGKVYIRPFVNGIEGPLIKQSFSLSETDMETTVSLVLSSVDISRSDVKNYVYEYQEYQKAYNDNNAKILDLIGKEEYEKFTGKTINVNSIGRLTTKEQAYNNIQEEYQRLVNKKSALNKLFYTKYSRFIQEGTWISEEYIDDDKYYHDACSVMYNSCYPKVSYTINLMELSSIPEYELFEFDIGDKTWVVDREFFGNDGEMEIIVTQKQENLDEPDKSTIQVQNFKNQFQDLFQKITATVQQAQYSQGSYEKAVALAEASNSTKMEFLSGALSEASAKISAAGQQSVKWGVEGITVTDIAKPTDSIRMVGGAIMLSKQDPITGEQKWSLGMTADGISANKITAGTLNAGEICIMNGKDPLFRWDAFGISAFDFQHSEYDGTSSITNVNPEKFVRFDKHGIYGVDQEGVSGLTWKPNNIEEIDQLATFALTWEGLKVTGEDGTVARMGKLGNNIFRISKNTEDGEEDYLTFSTDGKLTVGGWSVDQDGLVSYKEAPAQRTYSLRARAIEPAEEMEKIPAVYFVAEPRSESIEDWVTGETVDKIDSIMLKAGDNFMVSQDGTLYAKSGHIGPFKMGQVESDEYTYDAEKKLQWYVLSAHGKDSSGSAQSSAVAEIILQKSLFNGETKTEERFSSITHDQIKVVNKDSIKSTQLSSNLTERSLYFYSNSEVLATYGSESMQVQNIIINEDGLFLTNTIRIWVDSDDNIRIGTGDNSDPYLYKKSQKE